MEQGRIEQVRLADGRRLRGLIFPEFTVFIPKNRENLIAFGRREKKLGYKKLQGGEGRQNGYKGLQNGYKGGKLGVQKASGGGKKCWGYKSSMGSNKPKRKRKKSGDLFFENCFVLCRDDHLN